MSVALTDGSDTDCELTSRDYDRLQYVRQRALAKIARIKQRARMGIEDDSDLSDDSSSPAPRKIAKVARVRVQPKPKLHLSVRCRNLFEVDNLSTLQAVLGLFRLDPATGQFVLVCHAVAPRSELNPHFEQFQIDFTAGQEFLLRLYDRTSDSRIIQEEDVLGSAHFSLDDLIRDVAADEEAVYSISNPRSPVLQKHLEKAKATFFVKYSQGERRGRGKLIKVSCSNLPCETEKHSSPFAVLFKQDQSGFYQYVGRSESTTERVFPSFRTPLWVDEGRGKFKLSVYDSSSPIVTEQSRYGSCEFGNGDLKQEGELVKRLYNHNKTRGFGESTPLIHITVLGESYDFHKRVDSREVDFAVKTVPREAPQMPAMVKEIVQIMGGGRTFIRHVLDPARGPLFQRVLLTLKPEDKGTLRWSVSEEFTVAGTISSPLPSSSSSSVALSAITVLGEGAPDFVGRSSCFCFTVLAPPLCLHLEASSRNQRDAWLLGLQQLIPYLDASCKRLDVLTPEQSAECPQCSKAAAPVPLTRVRTLVVPRQESGAEPRELPTITKVDDEEIIRQIHWGLESARQNLATLRRQRTGLEEENKRLVNDKKLHEAIFQMMSSGQDFFVVSDNKPAVRRFVTLQHTPSALVWNEGSSVQQILLATVVELYLRPITEHMQHLAKNVGSERCLSFRLVNNTTVGFIAFDRMKRDAWGLSLRLLLKIEEPTPSYARN